MLGRERVDHVSRHPRIGEGRGHRLAKHRIITGDLRHLQPGVRRCGGSTGVRGAGQARGKVIGQLTARFWVVEDLVSDATRS